MKIIIDRGAWTRAKSPFIFCQGACSSSCHQARHVKQQEGQTQLMSSGRAAGRDAKMMMPVGVGRGLAPEPHSRSNAHVLRRAPTIKSHEGAVPGACLATGSGLL